MTISNIWNKSKKIIPSSVHKNVKLIYTHLFSVTHPNGYFKKFNFLDVKFLIKVNPKNGPVDNVILFDGVLDGEHLKIIKDILNTDDVFIDVGANIGQYSLFASMCLKDGKVISFEPVKKIFDQFKDSVVKNKINNIVLYNKACGSENKQILINKKNDDAGGSTFINLDFGSKKDTELVDIVILDDILISEDKVNFIKIDVEGFEYEVLLGLKNIINKFKPIFLIEYSPNIYKQNNPQNSELIIKFLLDNKYEITDLSDMKKVITDKHYQNKDIVMTYLLCK